MMKESPEVRAARLNLIAVLLFLIGTVILVDLAANGLNKAIIAERQANVPKGCSLVTKI